MVDNVIQVVFDAESNVGETVERVRDAVDSLTPSFKLFEKASADAQERLDKEFGKSEKAVEDFNKELDKTPPIAKAAESATSQLGSTLRRLAAYVSVGLAVRKFIQESIEAQRTTLQLDLAFRNFGKAAGQARKEMDDYATTIQRTTSLSDDDIKEAQATLLRFDKITGDTFKRTRGVIADFAALTGNTATGAAEQLGRALQDPARGMLFLRRAGIILSAQQQQQIKDFTKLGEVGKAQAVILDQIAKRSEGAAVKMRDTLGGAFTALNNQWGDLFEGDKEQFKSAIDAIHGLQDVLANPALRLAMSQLITGLTEIIGLLAKTVGGLAVLFDKVTQGRPLTTDQRNDTSVAGQLARDDRITGIQNRLAAISNAGGPGRLSGVSQSGIDALTKELAELIALQRRETGGTYSGDSRTGPTTRGRGLRTAGAFDAAAAGATAKEAADAAAKAAEKLQEEMDKAAEAARKAAESWNKSLDEMAGSIRTDSEQVVYDLNELRTKLDVLTKAGRISEEQAKAVLDAWLRTNDIGTLGPSGIELNEVQIKSQKARTKEQEEAIANARERALEMSRNIHNIFVDMFMAIGSGWKGMLNGFLQGVRQLIAQMLAEKFAGQMMKALFGSGGGTGGGGFLGAVVSGIGALFGKAGGGSVMGGKAYMVGERGPELFIPGISGGIVSNNKLAGAGGMTYSPVTSITITGAEDNRDIERRMQALMQVNNAKQKADVMRLLDRNGFGRLRA